ncbi:MAG: hypothetical protein SGARI_001360, partial [Bacillariaceae sp.]
MSATERNLKRLEKVIAVKHDKSADEPGGSFHLREATKPLLTPAEGKKMVALANQRLRNGDLEDLFGVTLKGKSVPNVPIMKHSSYKLESLLGHGQFHAVYDVRDETHAGQPYKPHNPHSNIKARAPEKVVIKTLRHKLQRHMNTARQISTRSADL